MKFESIAQYHTELLNGISTCVSTVQHFLFQIDAKQHLNAFVEVYERQALERAELLDRQRLDKKPIGKLHGVVVALKDVICYKDHRVTAASKILSGFTSIYNATAVNKLIEEGAIIIGNANCDEFAMGSTNENSCYGRVLNAIDETRVPGGSWPRRGRRRRRRPGPPP